MEMHVPHRAAVSPGFRLGDPVIHRPGLFLYLFRQMQGVDQFPDMPRRGVMMVVMMIMAMLVVMLLWMGMIVAMNVLMRMGMLMAVDVVMLMAMVVSTGSFFFSVYCHPHMCSGDPAGLSRLRLHMHARQSQTVHGLQKSLFIFQQFVQGSHQHIAGRPHVTFDV